MDPLSEIGEQVSLQTVNQSLEVLIREVREHRAWHRRAHKTALGVFSTVGSLVIGAIGWGATEYRGRAEARAIRPLPATAEISATVRKYYLKA